MQAEPADIRLNASPKGQRPARRPLSDGRPDTKKVAHSAIDEAFAALSNTTNRIDGRQPRTTEDSQDLDELIRKNQVLVASMVSQLETFDRQRQQLANLLNAVEIDTTA